MGLKDVTDAFSDIFHCLHERRDFMWVVCVVINHKIFSVAEMDIKPSFYPLEFMEYVCDIAERNPNFRK
jgi:hypothetical protein